MWMFGTTTHCLNRNPALQKENGSSFMILSLSVPVAFSFSFLHINTESSRLDIALRIVRSTMESIDVLLAGQCRKYLVRKGET